MSDDEIVVAAGTQNRWTNRRKLTLDDLIDEPWCLSALAVLREALVLAALRNHLNQSSAGQQLPESDRDFVERHLERVTVTRNEIRIRLREIVEEAPQELDARDRANSSSEHPTWSVKTIAVPWRSPMPVSIRGILHVPAHNTPITPDRREALLIAIAKARSWMDDLMEGRIASFAAIARLPISGAATEAILARTI